VQATLLDSIADTAIHRRRVDPKSVLKSPGCWIHEKTIIYMPSKQYLSHVFVEVTFLQCIELVAVAGSD